MPDFNEPQSRNEAILQNCLGANNELGEPQSRIEELLMQLLEALSGGGDVTAAAVLEAMEAMDSTQAADALDAIGGEPEKMAVTVTESGNAYYADKTFAEIDEAISAGKTVFVVWDNNQFTLVYYGEDRDALFFCINGLTNSDDDPCTVYLFYMNRENECGMREIAVPLFPTTVTDLSSTSITLANAAANTIYEYGELTALTVTAITATGDFIIRFTSGATATTTNFPATMKFPEAFSAAANTRYEINCSNGYALVAGWPTT